jgi:hypothetical protein
MMKTKMYQTLFKAAILASVAHIVVPAYADSQQQAPVMQTATGQLITPTAVPGAVQQELNPGLAGFPIRRR